MKKFRAWHEVEKRFVNVANIDFEKEIVGYDSQGEFNKYESDSFDKFIFQYSTGVEDINGIEIFEGDRLKCPWRFNDVYSEGFVVFWEGSFRLAKNEEPEFPEFGPYEFWNCNDIPTRLSNWEDAEIIGNIFEKSYV